MKYTLNIPTKESNYIVEFDNIYKCIKHIKHIVEGKIKQDWTVQLEVSINLYNQFRKGFTEYQINHYQDKTITYSELNEILQFNKADFIEYIFETYVNKTNDLINKNVKLMKYVLFSQENFKFVNWLKETNQDVVFTNNQHKFAEWLLENKEILKTIGDTEKVFKLVQNYAKS